MQKVLGEPKRNLGERALYRRANRGTRGEKAHFLSPPCRRAPATCLSPLVEERLQRLPGSLRQGETRHVLQTAHFGRGNDTHQNLRKHADSRGTNPTDDREHEPCP